MLTMKKKPAPKRFVKNHIPAEILSDPALKVDVALLPSNYSLRRLLGRPIRPIRGHSPPLIVFTVYTEKPSLLAPPRAPSLMAKMAEDASASCHGHIPSLAILHTYRKLGLATKLLTADQNAMESIFGAKYVSLHVRRSNRAANSLFFTNLPKPLTAALLSSRAPSPPPMQPPSPSFFPRRHRRRHLLLPPPPRSTLPSPGTALGFQGRRMSPLFWHWEEERKRVKTKIKEF